LVYAGDSILHGCATNLNPKLDQNTTLSEYFQRLYGDASSEMQALWDLCESSRGQLIDKYGDLTARFYVYESFDQVLFQKIRLHLKNAKLKVKGKDPKFLKRIEFAEFGFDYSEKIVELRRLMSDFERGNQKVEKIEESWNAITKLIEIAPKFAINFKDIGIDKELQNIKKSSKFLVGLLVESPYNPVKMKKNKPVEDEGLE
jgi:hypothetical protein